MRRFIHLLNVMFWLQIALVSAAEPVAGACSQRMSEQGVPQLVVPEEPDPSHEKANYFIGLLQLVFQVTEKEYGPCELSFTDNPMTRMRSAALINSNSTVDLFWGTTSREREALLRPIRIPLLRGLMGYKILLINARDQAKFSQVKTLADLQKFSAGIGSDWPDKKILEANGIRVVSSRNYEALFKMLLANRFDFFPRGASEVWTEVRNHPHMHLAIEKDLVLVYPAPVYFFVNENNLALANRIEKGLRLIIANGQFDAYFTHHPTIVDALQRVNISSRHKIYLANPELPEITPLNNKEFWLYPWYVPVSAAPAATEPF